jgi:Cu-Zn family superoxide dismutase
MQQLNARHKATEHTSRPTAGESGLSPRATQCVRLEGWTGECEVNLLKYGTGVDVGTTNILLLPTVDRILGGRRYLYLVKISIPLPPFRVSPSNHHHDDDGLNSRSPFALQPSTRSIYTNKSIDSTLPSITPLNTTTLIMSAQCICSLQSDSGSSVTAMLTLSQAGEGAPTIITGEIKGLTAPGKHGIALHAWGDLSDGGISCGPIYDPFGGQHGLPEDANNVKVGCLGNIVVLPENATAGVVTINITSTKLQLLGPHSVIGRSIVIYASEDDGGRGGHANSLLTGNSGPRVAAGVIGISKIA